MTSSRMDLHKARTRAGFTLIESLMAVGLFAGISYVLVLSMQANESSHDTIVQQTQSAEELRSTVTQLRDELKAARRASIQVTSNGGGPSTLSFQTAISAAGAPAWGAFDRRLDLDEDQCHKSGWTLRYGVTRFTDRPNQLVRQVINPGGTVQLTDNLADNVIGFQVSDSGDVWIVELKTMGPEGERSHEFDVHIRTN